MKKHWPIRASFGKTSQIEYREEWYLYVEALSGVGLSAEGRMASALQMPFFCLICEEILLKL